MKGLIYKITSPTGRVYIGQTSKTIEYRYRGGVDIRQKKLYNSVKKYGWENHSREVIDSVQFSGLNNWLLDKLEIYWIAQYDSFNNGLNMTLGGQGSKGSIRTKEMTDKWRKSIGDKLQSQEHRDRLSKALTGKKLTGKALENARTAFTGRTHSDETINKMKESRKKQIINPFANKSHSEETKMKMRTSWAERKNKKIKPDGI